MYTPDLNYNGEDQFDFIATDTAGASTAGHVELFINPGGHLTLTACEMVLFECGSTLLPPPATIQPHFLSLSRMQQGHTYACMLPSG